MELRHLRYFVAVADELNFRRAAERLHISQPPLTTQLRQLEEEIGAKLLERDSHHVALTAAGDVFLQSCRQLLRDADTAAQAARRAARGETGRLAISFIASLAHGIVPTLLRNYRRRFPDVELILAEMDTSQQLEELRERRLDVGLMGAWLPLENTELESVVIAEEPLIAALPEDHSLAQCRSLQLSALAHEKIVLASQRNASGYNRWLIRICEKAGFKPQIARESYRRTTTVLNYVAAGFGVTIVPAQFSRVPTSGIVFVPLARHTPLYRYCAV
ncbi:MAG: LysR family transcriptional regulator, partial [Verrucomicrobia bacterium]|nr:LysR family transcriptional regulator [Verrucomicrobiota bacterium]